MTGPRRGTDAHVKGLRATTTSASGPRDDDWKVRRARAEHVRAIYQEQRADVNSEVPAETVVQFVESLDHRAGVGARHHVVPRFVLARWAGPDERVQVYSRVEERFGVRNIRDLAIRDFYTFIDLEGERNSLLESLLSRIEADAAQVVNSLLSPFSPRTVLPDGDVATLALYGAFQVVRTPRYRRVSELQAEWYLKTRARGKVDEDELRDLTIVPHQNDFIRKLGAMAEEIAPYFHARPLALVTVNRPLLLIGDDPVVINPGPDEVHHVPDCFRTDEEIEQALRRNRRRNRRRNGPQGRIIHFSSTVPVGVGTALELVLPVSPRSALVWGGLGDVPSPNGIEVDMLESEESERFARLVNEATSSRALDWVVAPLGDASFANRQFPAHGPLMRVCDGTNAASTAVNMTPVRLRPHRLTRP